MARRPSFNLRRMMRETSDRVNVDREEKRKQREISNDLNERLMANIEANDSQKRKGIMDDRVTATQNDWLNSVNSLQRSNDAFEVGAGRQTPDSFNMRYGGGASGGSSLRSGGGKSTGGKSVDRQKLLMDSLQKGYAGRDVDFDERDWPTYVSESKDAHTAAIDSIYGGGNQQAQDPFAGMRARRKSYGESRQSEIKTLNRFNDTATANSKVVGANVLSGNPIRRFTDGNKNPVYRNKKTGALSGNEQSDNRKDKSVSNRIKIRRPKPGRNELF